MVVLVTGSFHGSIKFAFKHHNLFAILAIVTAHGLAKVGHASLSQLFCTGGLVVADLANGGESPPQLDPVAILDCRGDVRQGFLDPSNGDRRRDCIYGIIDLVRVSKRDKSLKIVLKKGAIS